MLALISKDLSLNKTPILGLSLLYLGGIIFLTTLEDFYFSLGLNLIIHISLFINIISRFFYQDEKDSNLKFLLGLPLTRKKLVFSRYFLAFMLTIFFPLLGLGFNFLVLQLGVKKFLFNPHLTLLISSLLLITGCFILPFLFKNPYREGYITSFFLLVIFLFNPLSLKEFSNHIFDLQFFFQTGLKPVLFTGIYFILLISFYLSCRTAFLFFQKRSLY